MTVPASTSPTNLVRDRRSKNAAGQRGRARDPAIDARILAVAHRHLSSVGYEALSVAAVAEEAQTTRQALYRRWPTKASLASAALAGAEDSGPVISSPEPLQDLAAELTDFQRGVSRPGRLSLVGTMLQDSTDAELRARYQERVIASRRQRIRTILQRAQELGLIDPDADLDIAVTLPTGSWYARALAGERPPRDWPQRTAELVWRAVGGTIPPADAAKASAGEDDTAPPRQSTAPH
jgi:AcrR family transcriptional regulator